LLCAQYVAKLPDGRSKSIKVAQSVPTASDVAKEYSVAQSLQMIGQNVQYVELLVE